MPKSIVEAVGGYDYIAKHGVEGLNRAFACLGIVFNGYTVFRAGKSFLQGGYSGLRLVQQGGETAGVAGANAAKSAQAGVIKNFDNRILQKDMRNIFFLQTI